ncbi:MAG: hypothetical protein V1646_03970 [bacterium]
MYQRKIACICHTSKSEVGLPSIPRQVQNERIDDRPAIRSYEPLRAKSEGW